MDTKLTSFPKQIEIYSDKVTTEYDALDNEYLKKYQYLATRFFTDDKLLKYPQRGILLYHMPGSGKSISALYMALKLHRPIIIICSVSIKENFRNSKFFHVY